MDRITVRLTPESGKKLLSEARKFSAASGKTVTVSDLIRACIGEKFPQVTARFKSETVALVDLKDQVEGLTERIANLERGMDDLLTTLSEVFKALATRKQVDSLADAIEAVFNAMRERG